MNNRSSSISKCQPSCGYYFSSGLVVSETVYSSASHGPVYNVASRIIVDGGRRVLQTAAMAGMLAQNFTVPGYAAVESGETDTSYTMSYFSKPHTCTTPGTGCPVSGKKAYNILGPSGLMQSYSIKNLVHLYVYSGGRVKKNGISGTAIETIYSGGVASNESFYNGGTQIVSYGGIAYLTKLANENTIGGHAPGYQYVSSGGLAISAIVSSGGSQFVLSGGIASDTIVHTGGSQIVYGGKTYYDSVYGKQEILSSGITYNDTVSKGLQAVSYGGTANNAYVSNSGSQFIYSGGIANGAQIFSGGSQCVFFGGIASGTSVYSGGYQCAYGGAVLIDNKYDEDSILDISPDAIVKNTTIGGTCNTNGTTSGLIINGTCYVSSGGKDYSASIIENGRQHILSSGKAYDTNISNKGGQFISSFGAVSSANVSSGGSQVVFSGGSALATTVNNGGWLIVNSLGIISSAVVSSGGDIVFSKGGMGYNISQATGGNINTDVAGSYGIAIDGTNQNGNHFMNYYTNGNAIASNFIINKNGWQNVFSNGISYDAIINDGGIQNVYSSGSTAGTVINKNGIQNVYGEGEADGTIINDGTQIIEENGTADSTVISGKIAFAENPIRGVYYFAASGGHQEVNGFAANTQLEGGMQYVYESGEAYATFINSGVQVLSEGKAYSTYIDGSPISNIVSRPAFQVVSSGGLAVSTAINCGEQHIYEDGVASGTIVSSGGRLWLFSGGRAYNVYQESGAAVAADVVGSDSASMYGSNENGSFSLSNGIASNFVLNKDGFQVLRSGGQAYNTEINGGSQFIIDGTAHRTILNSGGLQVISSGALALSATINSAGSQHILSGGIASNTLINISGWQYVYDGGSAINNIVGSGGSLVVYNGGIVSNTVVEFGGTIDNNDGHTQDMTIFGDYYVGDSSVDDNAVIKDDGHQHILYGGTANDTIIEYGGTQSVSSGGRANDTEISSGGTQNVLYGGRVYDTEISGGGILNAASGGEAYNVHQDTGGIINANVYGGDYETYIDGENADGNEMLLENGSASGFIIFNDAEMSVQGTSGINGIMEDTQIRGGTQIVSSGGIASGTHISNGGHQHVSSGGLAIDTVISAYGVQYISYGGIASSTDIMDYGSQYVYSGASAINFTISRYGYQYVESGAFVSNVDVNPDGNINITVNGSDYNTYVSGTNQNGNPMLLESGHASGFIFNENAWMKIINSGYAEATSVNSGGTQYVSNGIAESTYLGGRQKVYSAGSALETVINSGGEQQLAGYASGTLINSGGIQKLGLGHYDALLEEDGNLLSCGGYAENTTVSSGGMQEVYSSGLADSTTVLGGGVQIVNYGGFSSDTVVSSGGTQNLSGNGAGGGVSYNTVNTVIKNGGTQNINGQARAKDTVISSGGTQNLYEGGSISATVYHGGIQNIDYIRGSGAYADDTILSGGTQNLYSGDTDNTVINSGGRQNLFEGRARAYRTSINKDGQQHISGGYVSGTVINSRGDQFISSGGTAVSTVINKGGDQWVLNGGTASYTTVNSRGDMWVSSGGSANYATVMGNMWLMSGGIASGTAINQGGILYTTGNNTLYGNTVLDGGHIAITRGNMSVPATLTVQNLSGNGGVFEMSVSLQTPSQSDKILITGSHTGNSLLKLKNIGSSAAVAGNSLMLVQYASTAPVSGTFDLVGGKWDTAGYEYALSQSTGTDRGYYLTNTGSYSGSFNSMAGVPNMTVNSVQTALNSLSKRLGDLRNMSSDYTHGTWVRGYYKSMTVSETADTDMTVSGTEAGYDYRIAEGTFIGLMAGYMDVSDIKSDGGFNKGSGEGYTAGAYMTMLADNGWFFDLTARGFRTEYDMSNYTIGGDLLSFKPERTVFAGSIEAGRSFSSESGKGWSIEPKAEAQFMYAGEDTTEVQGGTGKLKIDDATYFAGIGSVNVSYVYERRNGLKTVPFAEAMYRHELAGRETVRYSEAENRSSMKGGTVEGRIGLNMQLTDNLYWHGAASYEKGSKVKSWGADGGIRYMFGGK